MDLFAVGIPWMYQMWEKNNERMNLVVEYHKKHFCKTFRYRCRKCWRLCLMAWTEMRSRWITMLERNCLQLGSIYYMLKDEYAMLIVLIKWNISKTIVFCFFFIPVFVCWNEILIMVIKLNIITSCHILILTVSLQFFSTSMSCFQFSWMFTEVYHGWNGLMMVFRIGKIVRIIWFIYVVSMPGTGLNEIKVIMKWLIPIIHCIE